ncbi:hypothetical protein LXL04_002368 [Taraxacum kok-saghyz]
MVDGMNWGRWRSSSDEEGYDKTFQQLFLMDLYIPRKWYVLDKEVMEEVQTQREIPDIRLDYIVQLKLEVPENKRRQIVTGGWDKKIKCWDSRSRNVLACVNSVSVGVKSVSLSGFTVLVVVGVSVKMYDFF